jgi:hypothetical protein
MPKVFKTITTKLIRITHLKIMKKAILNFQLPIQKRKGPILNILMQNKFNRIVQRIKNQNQFEYKKKKIISKIQKKSSQEVL